MSLRFKTVIGVAIIECFLLALLISTVLSYQHKSAEQALLKRAHTTATLFASTTMAPVLSHDLASLETFSEELMQNPDLLYVRVVDHRGQIYAERGIEAALAGPFTQDYSLDDAKVDGIFDVSSEISTGGVNYGRVELGFDIGAISDVIAETRELSISIAFVEMILVALFSFILGTYLTGQLKLLREGARQISAGNYETIIPASSKDELSEVAEAFNQMSLVLRESRQSREDFEQQLIDLNKHLERRVENRTEQINQQITDLRLANEKLSATQAQLVQSETLASVGQFAAGIAHEINNPIGYIKSNLSSLKHYIETYQCLLSEYAKLKEPDTQQSEQLQKIADIESREDIEFVNEDVVTLLSESVSGTDRVTSITRGLKQFFPEDEALKTLCDMNSCIAAAIEEVAHDNAQVSCDLGQLSPLQGDTDKLTHMISNLLRNALQATDDNGIINITSKLEENTIVVRITDNGSGIEPENIDRIFDPFFTTREVGQATGLGLCVCYGIIKNHQGTVDVESRPGEGATFTVKLPAEAVDKLAA